MYDRDHEYRPSAAERVRKWKRRGKIAGAVIGVVLSLATGAAGHETYDDLTSVGVDCDDDD